MNLQQLEYIVAVDTYRRFQTAADKCFVTQATLSMMIKKLEEEINLIIFDRTKHPVVPTEAGKVIIAQAKIALREAKRIKELVNELKGEISGELKIGIIPTLAPYLLPLFLNDFLKKYPLVKLKISELTTSQITSKLQQLNIDAGILATPLNIPAVKEYPLFFEQFVVYASKEEELMKKKYVLADDIDVNHLWLLEEGHCLRSQVINLCELRKKEAEMHHLDYEAGSVETLKKMVETNQGITILPELALRDLNAYQKKNIRYFKPPSPVREISIVTHRHFIKQRLIEVLKEEILSNIPDEMKSLKKRVVTEI
jgi:LysR family hydrogen peroxide-inducible transcriptional activator